MVKIVDLHKTFTFPKFYRLDEYIIKLKTFVGHNLLYLDKDEETSAFERFGQPLRWLTQVLNFLL